MPEPTVLRELLLIFKTTTTQPTVRWRGRRLEPFKMAALGEEGKGGDISANRYIDKESSVSN